nr:poly [ADP-ribose] polymerase 12-like [Onthophagus taurus]
MLSFQDVVMRYIPEQFESTMNTRLIQLSKTDSVYESIVWKHLSVHQKRTVTRIEKVWCPSLYGWYLMKKAEYQSRGFRHCEKRLLHVTGASNVKSILRSNLNWRRVTRYRFGRGVSFSDDADYADTYAARAIGSQRAMIIADVLVGNTAKGGSYTDFLPEGIDTATGNGRVYVKFHDDEFIPKYIVYYTH